MGEMSKSPEEIKKGLECCIGFLCMSESLLPVTLHGLEKHIAMKLCFNRIVAESGSKMRHKVYTLADYADRRKSTDLHRFKYCPYCGKKIDWAGIRRASNENS